MPALPFHTYYPPESVLNDSIENPLFSFIIITYDRARFLKEAIQSLLNQTYKNVEIIVVDHNAKETNRLIIEDFLSNNKNIGVVRFKENHGIYKVVSICWNGGLQYTNGQYVSVLNDDDMVSENYAEKMVALFKENKNCITAAPQPVSINENSQINLQRQMPNNRKRYMAGLDLAKAILKGDPDKLFTAPGGLMCFRKKSLLFSGGFDFLSDFTQIFKHSIVGDTGFDPEAKLYWRHHNDQYNKKLVGNGDVFYKRNVEAMHDSGLVEFWKKHLLEKDAKVFENYFFKILDDQCIDIFENHLRNGSLYKSFKVLLNIGIENPKLFTRERIKFLKLTRLVPFAVIRTGLKPVRLLMPLKYKVIIMNKFKSVRNS